jgi:hypothetical protein
MKLGVKAELKVGASGQFAVDVDGQVVAEKKLFGFPSEHEIVAAVGAAIGKKSA